MIKINKFWIRTLGILGMLGGILLFAGDLLFYYDSVSINLKMNMGHSSNFRITLSAITALFATWFYVLGAGHIYYAFQKSSAKARNTVVLSFIAIFIAYGIVHAAYVAIAISAKIALQYNIDLEQTVALADDINRILRLFIYPIFALLSIVFISQVWQRKTYYPRWIIAFFPLTLFFLKGVMEKVLTGGYWVIFVGGFFNLLLILFFLASTIALWNPKD